MGDVGKWRVDGVACGLAIGKKTKEVIDFWSLVNTV